LRIKGGRQPKRAAPFGFACYCFECPVSLLDIVKKQAVISFNQVLTSTVGINAQADSPGWDVCGQSGPN